MGLDRDHRRAPVLHSGEEEGPFARRAVDLQVVARVQCGDGLHRINHRISVHNPAGVEFLREQLAVDLRRKSAARTPTAQSRIEGMTSEYSWNRFVSFCPVLWSISRSASTSR